MRQSHEPIRSSDAFCQHQFSADCTINMLGFNFRQRQALKTTPTPLSGSRITRWLVIRKYEGVSANRLTLAKASALELGPFELWLSTQRK
jgi:hypothetical protein